MRIDTKKPKVSVGCKVPKEVKAALERLAQQDGLKLSPYVERFLLQHVRERNTSSSAA